MKHGRLHSLMGPKFQTVKYWIGLDKTQGGTLLLPPESREYAKRVPIVSPRKVNGRLMRKQVDNGVTLKYDMMETGGVSKFDTRTAEQKAIDDWLPVTSSRNA
nr:lysine histidine transporter 1-like [Tanacetum cinerariifolium]